MVGVSVEGELGCLGSLESGHGEAEFDPRAFLKPAMAAMQTLCEQRYEQFGTADLTHAANALLAALGCPLVDHPAVRSFIGDGAPKLVARVLVVRHGYARVPLDSLPHDGILDRFDDLSARLTARP